nr:hypothetical protein [Candidatus Levybacteria bacterium]
MVEIRTNTDQGHIAAGVELGQPFNPNLTTDEKLQMTPEEIRAWGVEKQARIAAIAEVDGASIDTQPAAQTPDADKKRGFRRAASPWVKGALAATLVYGAAFGALNGSNIFKGAAASSPEPSHTPGATATLEPTMTPSPEPTAPAEAEIKIGSVSFIGTPDNVDPKNVDKSDHKPFSHKIGLGSEMVLGEPGALLVGPDFGFTGKENPFGANPGGWNTMYESDGSIRVFSPVSQEVLHYAGPAYQNLPEGGFMMASAGQMDVKIGDFEIKMPSLPDNNYFLFVRGKFGDMKQDTDGNTTVEITNYQPGHALVGMYESGDNANVAFVSEGQFMQMAETSHSGGTNKGDGGASRLTAIFFDANTGAYTELQQVLGRNQDASTNWELVGSNWFTN